MASAAVHSNVMNLLFIHCLLLLALFVRDLMLDTCLEEKLVCVLSNFEIISLGRGIWMMYFCCVMNAMSLLSFFDSSAMS